MRPRKDVKKRIAQSKLRTLAVGGEEVNKSNGKSRFQMRTKVVFNLKVTFRSTFEIATKEQIALGGIQYIR